MQSQGTDFKVTTCYYVRMFINFRGRLDFVKIKYFARKMTLGLVTCISEDILEVLPP